VGPPALLPKTLFDLSGHDRIGRLRKNSGALGDLIRIGATGDRHSALRMIFMFSQVASLFPSAFTKPNKRAITAVFAVPVCAQPLLRAARHFSPPDEHGHDFQRLFAATKLTHNRLASAARQLRDRATPPAGPVHLPDPHAEVGLAEPDHLHPHPVHGW
jgi:hypothetical protein